MGLRKSELLRIWKALYQKLTPEDLEWLKAYRPGFWAKDEIHEPAWVTGLTFGIEDIVDAKMKDQPRTGWGYEKDRKEIDYEYGEGLPKPYAIEVAKILGINKIDKPYIEDEPKWTIIDAILKAIP